MTDKNLKNCKLSENTFGSDEFDTMKILPVGESYDCVVCKAKFSSPLPLTIHCIAVHRLKPCIKCLRLFSSQIAYENHLNREHGEHVIACLECGETFQSDSLLTDHIADVHLKTVCQMCDTFIDTNGRLKHTNGIHKISINYDETNALHCFRKTTKDVFHCAVCNAEMSTEKYFAHFLFYHKFPLGYILKRLFSENSSETILNAVALRYDDSEESTRCVQCKQKFTAFAPTSVHKIYCEGNIECSSCLKHFTGGLGLIQHIQSEALAAATYSDDFCALCNTNPTDAMSAHIVNVHNASAYISLKDITELYRIEADSESTTKYLCNFCDKNLDACVPIVDDLAKHYLDFHKFAMFTLLRLMKANPIKTASEEGDSIYPDIQEFIKQENTADMIIDFDSSLVKVVYSSASDCSDSDETVSNEIESTVCPWCDFKTRIGHTLAAHLNLKHGFAQKMDDFACNACKRKFKSLPALRRHRKRNIHSRRNQSKLACPFCAFTIESRNKLRIHISEHVESYYHPCRSTELGFNCKFCHHTFWVRGKLNDHVLARHDDLISDTFLICNVCTSPFISKTALRQHHSFKHPGQSEFEMLVYQCLLCRIAYTSLRSMRNHMEECHADHKAVYCAHNDCRQNTVDAAQLQVHVLNCHSVKR